MQAPEKIMQVFIVLLVGELILWWINPGNHRVSLFIGSSKTFVSFSYTGGFLTFVYVAVTKEFTMIFLQ